MLFDLIPRKIDTFELSIQDDIVIMKGDMYSSQEALAELSTFLNDIHKAALEGEVKQVIINVKELLFLNSSGLREILQWINRISLLPENQQYKVCFILDRAKSWQTTMIENLRMFCSRIVTEYSKDK